MLEEFLFYIVKADYIPTEKYDIERTCVARRTLKENSIIEIIMEKYMRIKRPCFKIIEI